MTTPVIDITAIVPQRYKTIIGTIGGLLTLVVPYVLSVQDYLPSPWPVVIGVVIWVLTSFGIYKAPYKPEGTILAVNPNAEKVSDSVPAHAPVASAPSSVTASPSPTVYPNLGGTGDYTSPWPEEQV